MDSIHYLGNIGLSVILIRHKCLRIHHSFTLLEHIRDLLRALYLEILRRFSNREEWEIPIKQKTLSMHVHHDRFGEDRD